MKYILPTIYILFMLWIFWKLRPIKTCPNCGANRWEKDEDGNEVDNFICVGYDCKYQKCKKCDTKL